MEIRSENHVFSVTPVPEEQRKEIPAPEELGFGKYLTDHMLMCDFVDGEWGQPRIVPYAPISVDPAAVVLHYAQTIFEGMKAYPDTEKNQVRFFRMEQNAARFNKSAVRMAMPEIPESIFIEGIQQLVRFEQRWIPLQDGHSLYIRPFMYGNSGQLGVKPSTDYTFCVILSPCGPYFSGAAKIMVEPTMARAVDGGTGEAKCGGNYACTIRTGLEAKKQGYDQVLWLDAKELRYVTEVGAMNFLIVRDNLLQTAELDGTILRGITRDSILRLAREHLGMTVEEGCFAIDELADGIRNGSVSECFGCGTAAVITGICKIGYKGSDIDLLGPGQQKGPVAQRLYDLLTGIQWGRVETPFPEWIRTVDLE